MKIFNRVVCAALLAIVVIAYPTSETKVEVAHAQSKSHAVSKVSEKAFEPTAKTPTVTEQPTPTVSQPSAEEEAKAFIYSHESSNNPDATNSGGCYGLGQDCNGIVKVRCGADYSCQDAFFTNYMLRRYGTWQAAKSFWLSHYPNWW